MKTEKNMVLQNFRNWKTFLGLFETHISPKFHIFHFNLLEFWNFIFLIGSMSRTMFFLFFCIYTFLINNFCIIAYRLVLKRYIGSCSALYFGGSDEFRSAFASFAGVSGSRFDRLELCGKGRERF